MIFGFRFEDYEVENIWKGEKIIQTLADTTGLEDGDRIRPLSYPQVRTWRFMLNFSYSLTICSAAACYFYYFLS